MWAMAMIRSERLHFFLSVISFIMKIPASTLLSEALQRQERLSMMMVWHLSLLATAPMSLMMCSS